MVVFIGIAVAVVVLGLLIARRGSHSHTLDAGVVSARWLSDLRRDDPWTRS